MKKKLLAIFVALLLATSTFGTALAAGTEDTKSAAGITPDSILYPVDKAIESIRLALTAGDIEKATLLTEFAEERLAEASVMLEEGKTELADTAAKDYTDTIGTSDDKIQTAIDEATGTEVTDTTEPDTKASVLDELLNRNIEIQKHSVDVLAGLLDKLPEEARDKITAVIVKQIMQAEAVRDFVDTKKAYNNGAKDVRDAEKSLNDAEKSGEQTKIDAAKAFLLDAKSKLAELLTAKDSAADYKKDIKAKIEEKLAEIKADNSDGSTVDSQEGSTVVTDEEEVENDTEEGTTAVVDSIKLNISHLKSAVEKELKKQDGKTVLEQDKEKAQEQKDAVKENNGNQNEDKGNQGKENNNSNNGKAHK